MANNRLNDRYEAERLQRDAQVGKEVMKMAFFRYNKGNKSDTVITLFALVSILMAGGISLATISTDKNSGIGQEIDVYDVDPLARAEQAALAAISAARGHIECHGITESGGLADQYYANGARFTAVWDEINLADSTVRVAATGYCLDDSGEEFKTRFESVIKVELLKAHERPAMHDYYKSNLTKMTNQ